MIMIHNHCNDSYIDFLKQFRFVFCDLKFQVYFYISMVFAKLNCLHYIRSFTKKFRQQTCRNMFRKTTELHMPLYGTFH